jgi:acetate kinase
MSTCLWIVTAGIGEHDPETRAEVAAGCRWLGLKLDTARNRVGGGRISAPDASVAVWVVPTDEERMIARYASQTLAL